MGADSRLVEDGFDIGIRKSWEDAIESVKKTGGIPYGKTQQNLFINMVFLGYVGFAEEVRQQEKDLILNLII